VIPSPSRGLVLSGLFVAGTACLLALRLWPLIDRPLNWDEVDYAQAGRRGIRPNALGCGELGAFDFAKLAVSKARGAAPPQGLPPEDQDTFNLRHFHPPLPVYYWSLFSHHDPATTARRLRLAQLPIAAGALISALAALAAAGRARLAALGCRTLPILASGTGFVGAFSSANFHVVFLVAALVHVACAQAFLQQPTRRRAVVLGASAALCMACLETAVVLLLATLTAVQVLGSGAPLRERWRQLLCGFGVALLVVWPGVVTTGGVLRSWGLYAYRIALAGNREYARVTPGAFWATTLRENAALTVLLAVAAVVIVRAPNTGRKAWALPALATAAYALFITPFALSPTYVAPALAIGWLAATMALGESVAARREMGAALSFVGAAILVAGLGSASADVAAAVERTRGETSRFQSDLDVVKNGLARDPRPWLLEGGHIWRFYLGVGPERVDSLYVGDRDKPGVFGRVNYQYVALDQLVRSGTYACVGVQEGHSHAEAIGRRLLEWGATRVELATVVLGCFPSRPLSQSAGLPPGWQMRSTTERDHRNPRSW
jgi:hypothetical protein